MSTLTVAGFFIYEYYRNWHGWIPLGYDSYYYVGYINQVVEQGPIQFAASQHYVEFLYPIVASIPVYLGASAEVVEIVLPAFLACSLVMAIGVLARESDDWRVAIFSVAFSSGWFAVYRMGADFHANLFAFPLLVLATKFLVRVARKGETSKQVVGGFLLLVVLAGAAHVETTDFFILTWIVAFLLLGRDPASGSRRWSMFMILAGALVASPFSYAYFQDLVGGFGVQYCIFPPYWLEVFGPAAGLAILGLGAAAWRLKAPAAEGDLVKLLLPWSGLAIAIGLLGYVAQVPIVFSDRVLLLFPLPLVSSLGMIWLVDHVPRLQHYSQTDLMSILAVAIPLLVAPLVFSYAAPHFRYFADHGPSFVTCVAK